MPKEIVFENREFVSLPDGSEEPVTEEHLGTGLLIMRRGTVVRWERGLMSIGLGVAKLEVSAHGEHDPHYLELDRSGINRLIRALRKARDQAFGADA